MLSSKWKLYIANLSNDFGYFAWVLSLLVLFLNSLLRKDSSETPMSNQQDITWGNEKHFYYSVSLKEVLWSWDGCAESKNKVCWRQITDGRQFAWRTEFRDAGVNRMAISDVRYKVKVT